MGASEEVTNWEGVAVEKLNILSIIVGLTAISIGLMGLFEVISSRRSSNGYEALILLATSLANMTLGFILLLAGLMRLWY